MNYRLTELKGASVYCRQRLLFFANARWAMKEDDEDGVCNNLP